MSRNHRYRVRVTLSRDGRSIGVKSRVVNALRLHDARQIADDWAERLVFEHGQGDGRVSARVSVVVI